MITPIKKKKIIYKNGYKTEIEGGASQSFLQNLMQQCAAKL